MHFIFPIDGDMLNRYDAVKGAGRTHVNVRVAALPHGELYVNRVKLTEKNRVYSADVPVYGYRNTLALYDAQTNETKKIVVYWADGAVGTYRLWLDDNIWCLKDLAANADTYKSLFDNPYFALYKKAHEQTGAKVHMNIYHRCDGFDLSMMPDKYKNDFKDNADWLRLAFHARQNDPDRIYRNASFDEIYADYDMVVNEIRRFAGQHIAPTMVLHWAVCPAEGVRALRAHGIRILMALPDAPGNIPRESYYHDLGQTLNLMRRNFWKDNAEDMVFGRVNIILNTGSYERILPFLDTEKTDPHRGGSMELLIHEQYFYPHYSHYLPDYEKRVMMAVKWAAEHGYKPAWLEDCVLE